MSKNKSFRKKLEEKRTLFFQIGLSISLLITFAAFEWRTEYSFERDISFSFGDESITFEEIIPITIRKEKEPLPPPPKPLKKSFTINVVKEPVTIINPAPIPDPDPVLAFVEPKPEPVYVEPPLPVMLSAEVMPMFPGGENALIKYLGDNINYPAKARENKISGLVYLQLTVDEKGNVVNVQVLRGVGGGCEAEAMRVISAMPKWEPGRQGGKAVPVRLTVPIRFTLM